MNSDKKNIDSKYNLLYILLCSFGSFPIFSSLLIHCSTFRVSWQKMCVMKFHNIPPHFIFAAALCLFFPNNALSRPAEPVSLQDTMTDFNIGLKTDIFEDTTAKMGIDDISGMNGPAATWVPSKKKSLNLGFSASALWIRFSVTNPEKKKIDWFLEIGYPQLDFIDLYIPGNDGKFILKQEGDHYAFSHREVSHRNFIFTGSSAPGTTKTCYLKIRSNGPLTVPLSLWTPAEFYNNVTLEQPMIWIYYGLLISMIIYNLFLYVSIRDKNYLYYVLFLVSLILFTMSLNGLSYEYLWPDSTWWTNKAMPVLISTTLFTGGLFCKTFLDFKKTLPAAERLILFSMALALLGIVFGFTLTYEFAIKYAIVTVSASAIPLLGGIYLSFRRYRPAYFFIIAFSGVLIGNVIYAMKAMGFLPHNVFTNWSFQMGYAWQAVLLALGITDQINTMKNRLADLNVNLEEKVSERTEELHTAMEELSVTNARLIETRDALWGEMELAKKIQTVLLPSRPRLSNYELSAYMDPADEVGGDYYDIINVDGREWIIIGDVSGHGVQSGLIMMMVQTAIRLSVNQDPGRSPSELLVAINKTITDNIRLVSPDKYMTINVFAVLENGVFRFSGLHQDIMIYRSASGTAELVETSGIWLGLYEDITGLVRDDLLTLNVGDCMLIFTDGITEAWRKGSIEHQRDPSSEMFGNERLKSVFSGAAPGGTDVIKKAILEELRTFDLNDDITMVIVKRTG